MNKFNRLFQMVITSLVMFLIIASPLLSQDDLDDFGSIDDFGGDGLMAESPIESEGTANETSSSLDKPSLNEQDFVDKLYKEFTPNGKWIPTVNKKDPFKPIVEKKVILPPVRRVQPVARKTSSATRAPTVKPIRLFIQGIVGNDGHRFAIVKFENEEYTIIKDQIVDGKFKVVDIQSDRVVVYSNKEKRRHTFKIGGDEK